MQKRLKQTDIFKKAADLVARRPHFSKELELKLLKRGYEKDPVLQVIQDFQTKGFINDKETAELYIEELKRKRHSRYYVVQKLVGKGLVRSFAEEMVRTFFLENEERQTITYLLDTKHANPDSIIRKGFDVELVRDVFGRKGDLGYTED